MSIFRRRPRPLTPEEARLVAERWARIRRDDAAIDRHIEADERSQIPCADCGIGEPHACERAYWQQRTDHLSGRECADAECVCHPEKCDCCGQSLEAPRPVNA